MSDLRATVEALWARLLGPGREDEDLYAAGGDDLIALRLLRAVHARHPEGRVTWRTFRAAPRVEHLCRLLEQSALEPDVPPPGAPLLDYLRARVAEATGELVSSTPDLIWALWRDFGFPLYASEVERAADLERLAEQLREALAWHHDLARRREEPREGELAPLPGTDPEASSPVRGTDLVAGAPSHVRQPDPAAAPSPVRGTELVAGSPSHVRQPDPAAAPSPVRGTDQVGGASSHVRQQDQAAAPSHVRQPDQAAAASHVRQPDPAAAPSPVRQPAALSHVRQPDQAAAASHVRQPEPAAAPSHVRQPDPAAAPSHVRQPAALSHVRQPDLAAAPSHVRQPDQAAAPSHVRRPDPAAAPSPVRGTEPVAGASSHVRQPDPAAAPSHVRQPDPAAEPSHVRGPDVAFLLSAPRSGSTLLRLILAGHPALHCGPELNLLHHETLGDWRRARLARFGAASGVVEGLLRELRIPAAAFDPCEPIRLTYRRLRDAVAPGLLVDKTPSYTKGLGLLLRAEGLFARPRYVHLVRHPLAVIDSFVRQRFHVLIPQEGLDPHAAAERVWAERNRNVLALRARIGPARVHCLRFEDLVRDPRATLAPLCAFLGVDLHEALFEPFAPGRGAGGPGDYGVLDRDALDPSLAEAWRRVVVPRDLAPDTWSLAERFGYPRP